MVEFNVEGVDCLTPGGSSIAWFLSPNGVAIGSSMGDKDPSRGTSLTGCVRSHTHRWTLTPRPVGALVYVLTFCVRMRSGYTAARSWHRLSVIHRTCPSGIDGLLG